MTSNFWNTMYSNQTTSTQATTKLFTIVGLIWFIGTAFNYLNLIIIYLFRESSMGWYASSSGNSWALVTGSSDGIGKGFAEELCSQGFNVILHGRNQQKLERVREELLAQWPARQVELVVIDVSLACSDVSLLEKALNPIKNLDLRVLVNNVGGTVQPMFAPLADRSATDIEYLIYCNARFATEITRVLLPQLQRTQPSLIISIGSGMSDFPVPYVQVLAGAKAFNQAWARCLAIEMRAEKQDIEVLHCQVGLVSTGYADRPVSLMVPSSRNFARHTLNRVGCRRDVIWPYLPHAVQFGLMANMPRWLRNWVVLNMARKEIQEEKEKNR